MNSEKTLNIALARDYLDEKDLRFDTTKGYLLSKSEYDQFKELKDEFIDKGIECNGVKCFFKIPLKTFDSKHIFFVRGIYLMNALKDYLNIALDDYNENKKFLIERRSDDIITARIFSEIEGTLNIENIKSTHKRIKQVCESGDLKDRNDIIIRNMNNAISFIVDESPEFNKENLYKLYNIVSKDCLKDDDQLNGNYYRDDSVTIGNGVIDRDKGAPYNKIEEMMDGLFEFVAGYKQYKDEKDVVYLLPHICHYYILYVHPYFDYNGRTARMVSFWISWLLGAYSMPLFISEAINENKNEYYKAIANTRNSNNDLTYFLGYIFKNATNFSLIYKNVEYCEKELAVKGDFLSNSERLYLKKILIHSSESYFNVKMFIEFVDNNITKQGAFKVLNLLTEYGLLELSENKRGESIYKLNKKFIKYKYSC